MAKHKWRNSIQENNHLWEDHRQKYVNFYRKYNGSVEIKVTQMVQRVEKMREGGL